MGNAHAFPAAACRCLDDYGVSYSFGGPLRLFFVLDYRDAARDDRQARFLHIGAGCHFIAHQPDILRGRADKSYPAGSADFRKMRVFCQEPVSRMYGIYIRNFCGADNRGDIQIAIAALGLAYADSFFCETYV